MGLLSFLFGNTKKQLHEAIMRGAAIIDVRTDEEFSMGSIKQSKNIPLDSFTTATINQLKKNGVPVVVCCESGIRSASANRTLRKSGIESYNGGTWRKVDRLLKEVS